MRREVVHTYMHKDGSAQLTQTLKHENETLEFRVQDFMTFIAGCNVTEIRSNDLFVNSTFLK